MRTIHSAPRARRRRPAFLRMPPFPGARPAAALDPARMAPLRPGETVTVAALEELAELLRHYRVGGSFWRTPPALPAGATILSAESIGEDRVHLTARAIGGGPVVIAGIGMDGARSKRGDGARGMVMTGVVDLWALLTGAGRVVAGCDDEIALVAGALGTRVLDPETLLPHDRIALLRNLAQRVEGVAYHCPFTGAALDARGWLEMLGDWRRTISANAAIGQVLGIKAWKRPVMRQLLWSGEPPVFRDHVPSGRTPGQRSVALWRSRVPEKALAALERAGCTRAEIEDGFIRSTGLGTLLHPPFSIVVDTIGAHYDASRASDLERILAETHFGDDLCTRAARLIATIVANNITKYASGDHQAAALPRARRRVLVPGQVEDDLSVRHSGGAVRDDLGLLERVRSAEPHALLVYKPHPDVVSGHRRGGAPSRAARRYADLIVEHGSIAALLSEVDAVHVISSLTGFEALLRGREVVTHGTPFYAGWGLTRDLAGPFPRRARRLTLEQLVAGALILYPRYLDPLTRLPCPAEMLVRRLSEQPAARAGLVQRLRAAQGRLAVLGRSITGPAA